MHQQVKLPGEFCCESMGRTALKGLGTIIRRSRGTTIRRISAQGQFGQEHHGCAGPRCERHALSQPRLVLVRIGAPAALHQANSHLSGNPVLQRAGAGQLAFTNEFQMNLRGC